MIPYTTEVRPDTGVSNVTMGFWLFIASEVMLFGALFSSYALLRVSATDWPSGRDVLSLTLGSANTVLLVIVSLVALLASRVRPQSSRGLLIVVSVLATLFLGVKGLEYNGELGRGLVPATSTFVAMYYTLTGIHALHILGGIAANIWIMAGMRSMPEALTSARLRLVSHYWIFVDLVWLAIFIGMYLA